MRPVFTPHHRLRRSLSSRRSLFKFNQTYKHLVGQGFTPAEKDSATNPPFRHLTMTPSPKGTAFKVYSHIFRKSQTFFRCPFEGNCRQRRLKGGYNKNKTLNSLKLKKPSTFGECGKRYAWRMRAIKSLLLEEKVGWAISETRMRCYNPSTAKASPLLKT